MAGPFSLSATDTISAVAGTNNVISYTFDGDNIVAGADTFKVLPQGLIPSSVGTIWPALAGQSLVYLLLCNTTGSPVTGIKLFLNGTAPTNQIGPTFTIPANGGAFISANSMQVFDSTGAVITTSNIIITGDATGSGVGTIPITLATVNGAPGTTGDATHTSTITTNGKGLVTANTQTLIQIPTTQVTAFDTQVRTSRLDQMAAPTADVSMNSHKLTNVLDATNATDAPNFAQVQAIAEGRDDKEAVEWGTTAPITLLGLGTQAGGEWTGTLLVTDRILVKDQALTQNDGIYTPSAGAWTRTLDANTGTEITNATVLVEQGATLRGDTWRQSAVVTTIGTDPQTWVQIGEGDPFTLTNVGAAPNAQGASLAGQALTLQPANGSFPGLLSAAGFTNLGNQSGTNTGNVTLTAVGAAPNANAATLTGQALNLQPASASFPGVITSAQFVVLNNTSGTNSGNVSLGAVGASPNANGATLAGQALNLELASASFPGLVTAAQFTKLANTSGTNTGDQNLFASVTGNSGTATADALADTLALTGSGSVSTVATDTPDGVVISNAAATTTAAGNMSSTDKIRMGGILDAQADFGFIDDLRGTGDGTCSTGAPTKITSATAAFVAGDNGKRITLAGAGAAAAMYVGTITNIDSGTQVTVSPSISTTVSNFALQLGTDNTAAENALLTAVNTTFATYPGLQVLFGRNPGTGRTGRYGLPIQLPFTRPVILCGTGRGFTADTGVADQVGGSWLCWWGTTADGGTAFSPFISFRSNQNNNMKGTGLRDLSVDGSNGSQYGPINQVNTNALIGVKLATVNGFSWDNVFIRNCGAMGLWCDIDATPTEQESVSRGMISNLAFRCLDNGPGAVTTPFLMTSAVTLTTTPQNLTVAANALPAAGYFWTATTVGRPVLVNYTSGGGTTTLVGCTVSAEDNILTPVTVNGGNIVQAVPSTSAAAVLSGNTTANTNLSMFQMWQLSIGTTWGPAGIECLNADSVTFQEIVVNGGNGTNDGAINRIRKPGVRFNGHQTTLGLAARNNVFYDGDPGAGGVSNMALLNTGAKMTAPSGPNYWWGLQLGNAAPQPTIELGGYLEWTANGGVSEGLRNISQANQAFTASTLTQIAGSVMLLPPQAFQVGTVFRWRFNAVKTAAGAAASLYNVRVGTLGTTADANVNQISRTPTAAIDYATCEILYTITAIGASATGVATLQMQRLLSTTGLATVNNVIIGTPTAFNSASSGFLYISLSTTSGAAEVVNTGFCTAEILRVGNQGA